MPNRQEQHQGWDYQEWEPSDALTSALGNVPLQPGTNRDGQLATLKPHLQEALMTLERHGAAEDPVGKREDAGGGAQDAARRRSNG